MEKIQKELVKIDRFRTLVAVTGECEMYNTDVDDRRYYVTYTYANGRNEMMVYRTYELLEALGEEKFNQLLELIK